MSIEDIDFICYKKLYISDSTISGKGLFSYSRIKKGDIILRFGGIITNQKLRYSGRFDELTFIGIADGILLCEEINTEKDVSDFINHSCSPNTGLIDAITLVAIRDIEIGEELTCDYAFWETDEEWEMPCICNCGSENCRKYITGLDWKKTTSCDYYFRFYSPFLKRRILYYENSKS